MPTGEVDTSAVASAVLQSGTRLVPLAITTGLSTVPLFHLFFFLLSSLIPLTRKEFIRAEGGLYTPVRDGRIQDLRRRGSVLAAERRLGHQRTGIPIRRDGQDERCVNCYTRAFSPYLWIDGGAGLDGLHGGSRDG